MSLEHEAAREVWGDEAATRLEQIVPRSPAAAELLAMAPEIARVTAENQARIEEMARLSAAFQPGSMEGLAKRLWELRREIPQLERERDNLHTILREYCQRTGESVAFTIAGKKGPVAKLLRPYVKGFSNGKPELGVEFVTTESTEGT